MQPNEYQLVRDVLLEVLSGYEDGVSVGRLVEKVSESMPYGEVLRPAQLRSHLKRARIDLEAAGLIERVPDADPVRIRLPVGGREGFMDAARRGHVVVLKRLLAEGVGQETKDAALISAVINNFPDAVRLLLDCGANAHAEDDLFGRDALTYVTGRTGDEIVRLLETASGNRTRRARVR